MKIKYIKTLLGTLIFTIIFFVLISSTMENIDIKIQISEFKKKGVFQESISTETIKYYKVSRETWMNEEKAINVVDGKTYYGSSGDIIIGLESAIKDYPIISDAITYFVGGHASFVCYEYEDNQIKVDNTYHLESSTLKKTGVNAVKGDFWNRADYRDEVVGLRVKTSEDIKIKAFNEMISNLGAKYNYTYIFNQKNRYYCTDLISRAFSKYKIDLNYDGGACTVQDLFYSNETYMFFYKIVKKNISYIYYLE